MTTTPAPDAKGVLEKIRELLTGSDGGGANVDLDLDLDAGGAGNGRVPYSRFAAVAQQLKAERQRTAALGQRVEELSNAYDASLNSIRTEAAENVKGLGLKHNEDLQLVDLGIRDPLGRKAVREAWEHAPKESRGKSAAEWWGATLDARKAHHEDAEKHQAPTIPQTLSGYLPKLEDAGSGAGGSGGRSGGGAGGRKPPPDPPKKAQSGGADGIVEDKGMQAFLSSLPG